MKKPVVAHLIDSFSPDWPSWFNLLIKNLGAKTTFSEKYVNSDNNHAKNLNVIYSNSMINSAYNLKIALRPLKNKLRDYLKNNFRKIRANIIHAFCSRSSWKH